MFALHGKPLVVVGDGWQRMVRTAGLTVWLLRAVREALSCRGRGAADRIGDGPPGRESSTVQLGCRECRIAESSACQNLCVFICAS